MSNPDQLNIKVPWVSICRIQTMAWNLYLIL